MPKPIESGLTKVQVTNQFRLFVNDSKIKDPRREWRPFLERLYVLKKISKMQMENWVFPVNPMTKAKRMLHAEYVFLDKLTELNSVNQVREEIDNRKRQILTQLENE